MSAAPLQPKKLPRPPTKFGSSFSPPSPGPATNEITSGRDDHYQPLATYQPRTEKNAAFFLAADAFFGEFAVDAIPQQSADEDRCGRTQRDIESHRQRQRVHPQ